MREKIKSRVSSSPVFILGATFIAAYIPTVYAVIAHGEDPVSALRKPDVVGGLMGLLFSVLLSIGESNYLKIKESLDTLNKKIEAQSHGNRLQEAYLKAKEGPFSPLFGELAELRLKAIHSDLANMKDEVPFYEVRQNDPVKEYVDIFVQLMLKIIQPESEFRVVTTELIWSRDSFGGPDRRYLLANYIAAKERQVRINRIFMVVGRETLRRDLDRAKGLLETLRDHARTFSDSSLKAELSVYEVESDTDYHSFFKNPSNNFALWKVSEGHEICTVVEYTYLFSSEYRISGCKFASDPLLVREKNAVFENLSQRSISLREYIEVLERLVAEVETPQLKEAS